MELHLLSYIPQKQIKKKSKYYRKYDYRTVGKQSNRLAT